MAQQPNPAAQAVSNIYRTPELWQKITFTFLCMVIYRIGAHITAPGIDVQALTDYFTRQQGGGLLGLYDMFVGGGLSRATVFALGIMPYISASIFVQIAGAVLPNVDKMQKDEDGRAGKTTTHEHVVEAEKATALLAGEVVGQRLDIDPGRRDMRADSIDHHAQEREGDLLPELRRPVDIRDGLGRRIGLLCHALDRLRQPSMRPPAASIFDLAPALIFTPRTVNARDTSPLLSNFAGP